MNSEKVSSNYSITRFMVKQWKMYKIVRDKIFFKKVITKLIKRQSNLTFNEIHKSYENCDSYTFKQNEVLMDRPI